MNKEYNDLLIENMKLKDKLEQQRKEYQETYKDVREEIKDYKKQLEEKDKIIDKVSARLKLLGQFDGKYCTRNFKMMSADFNQLIEWLESDK